MDDYHDDDAGEDVYLEEDGGGVQADAEAEADAAMEMDDGHGTDGEAGETAEADAAATSESAAAAGGEAAAAAPGSPARTTLKRPMSAYFLFAGAIRGTIQAELDAAAAAESAATGTTVKSQSRSLAVVGKIVGERWKNMTDEEKEVYTMQAAEAKEKYDEAIRLDPSLKGVPTSKNGGAVGGSEFVLPLGRIKKIMDLDPEKSKMSKEALQLTEKAVERFLMWLATRTHLHASEHKRKGLKAQDVEHLVRSDGRLEFLRAPLKRDFERYAASEASAADMRKERIEEQHKRKRQKEEETTEANDEAAEDAEGEEGAAGSDTAASPRKAAPAKPKTRTIDSMFSKA